MQISLSLSLCVLPRESVLLLLLRFYKPRRRRRRRARVFIAIDYNAVVKRGRGRRSRAIFGSSAVLRIVRPLNEGGWCALSLSPLPACFSVKGGELIRVRRSLFQRVDLIDAATRCASCWWAIPRFEWFITLWREKTNTHQTNSRKIIFSTKNNNLSSCRPYLCDSSTPSSLSLVLRFPRILQSSHYILGVAYGRVSQRSSVARVYLCIYMYSIRVT